MPYCGYIPSLGGDLTASPMLTKTAVAKIRDPRRRLSPSDCISDTNRIVSPTRAGWANRKMMIKSRLKRIFTKGFFRVRSRTKNRVQSLSGLAKLIVSRRLSVCSYKRAILLECHALKASTSALSVDTSSSRHGKSSTFKGLRAAFARIAFIHR